MKGLLDWRCEGGLTAVEQEGLGKYLQSRRVMNLRKAGTRHAISAQLRYFFQVAFRSRCNA